ncbi:hypothetical protein H5410_013335 [Solanum commersonii]|uniref:Uncharacterized protein n=1 Tax=Solanum commersonii TaxID=4109 RepID=A0A9J6AU74_SOLCO|nr:hypothetical protein H5410_013335 [Solanum commersonii]
MEKDNKNLRAAMLKKRYANVILKSQQQVLGKAFDGEKMKKKAKLCEKQLQEEKPKSQLERDRKAARITIESIHGTVHFDDALQAERDFLAIISATSPW